ncbi:DNA-binding FadR family transcriptional regulator [Rhizomicrobium palustre]|uniref:DNA-binding FadR family transcriptional regulator n=1 Tax=Rhizomicrobium palustre TaxID=189966 RepID=A0A846N154_9PROT|nr:FadR/GntR family transcriptional regulator [Rhizomicrobium palustre]NIK89658.1 DNA-binding FadR family transcriptional regulator [Rhizomicrobium palustre]
MRKTSDGIGNSVGLSPVGGLAGSNLTFRIMEDLGIAIVTGHYSEKNPFPIEASLCEKYSVSRSVLREAVKMLTAKGLLSARPRHGTWVQPEQNWNFFDPDVLRWLLERKLSYSLLIEFTQMRMAVEPFAAATAAQTAGAREVAPILHALSRMTAAEQGDDDPLTSDIAFHVAVMKASGNRFYEQLCDMIDTALRISIRMTNQLKGVRQASVADHKKVADAIIAHDPATAQQAMQVMLDEAMELIVNAQRQSHGEREPLLVPAAE